MNSNGNNMRTADVARATIDCHNVRKGTIFPAAGRKVARPDVVLVKWPSSWSGPQYRPMKIYDAMRYLYRLGYVAVYAYEYMDNLNRPGRSVRMEKAGVKTHYEIRMIYDVVEN